MPQIKLYNSLTRKKEALSPVDPEHVKLYACGPTVYSYAHIGNARMAVVFDMLRAFLDAVYPKVTFVSNITDINDNITDAAKDAGVPIQEIIDKYTNIYNQDLAALGVEAPDIQPRATEHVTDMITQIEQLIDNGHAYEAPEGSGGEGHVLFHVPSFGKYGGLSGRSRDEQIAGARVDVSPYKKDPADFVLWKPSTDDQPGWESPWGPNNGRGRPGWHIECSAMAEAHLGLPFDIHGGGADLKFPHHENEIAQSCCAQGSDDLASFARMWVHNGFVTAEGEKMSKSLGNVVLVHDLLDQGVEGEAIRLALMSSHYRQPLDWTKNALGQATKTLNRFYKILEKGLNKSMTPGVYAPEFLDALCDDLNVPGAMTSLYALAKTLEKDPDNVEALSSFVNGGILLGLFQSDPATWLAAPQSDVSEAYILEQIAARAEAKANKDYAAADAIRDELLGQGIALTDGADGTSWTAV